MPKYSSFGSGWDKDDQSDVRKCVKCGKPMRHRLAKEEAFPDTVAHRAGGACKTCCATPVSIRKAKTPEEEARRIEAAHAVARQVRARRERLGISESGAPMPGREARAR